MAAPRVTVACVKWGTPFPPEYVNILAQAVKANLKRPHRFVCVTDDGAGLGKDVEVVALPEIGIPEQWKRKGCWPKMTMFKPGVFEPDEPVLYLDLDLMILQSLEEFFARIEERPEILHILREWNSGPWWMVPLALRPDRGAQSSVVGFVPKHNYEVFEKFMADPDFAYRTYPTDQNFISAHIDRREYFPDAWTRSFKRHVLYYYPLSLLFPIVPPKDAKILVFHGSPRPIDLTRDDNSRWGTSRKFGYGPVSWVKDYWIRFRKAAQEAG